MPSRPDVSELLLPGIDRGLALPLLRQLYLALRGAMLAGALPAGARLPATRALAQRLGIARNTVVAAYEQLLAEGFIEARAGAGTFVSADLPPVIERPALRRVAPQPPKPPPVPCAPALPSVARPGVAPFNTGRTSWDDRSRHVWRQVTLRRLQNTDPAMLGYADPRGALALRVAIARYLHTARAVRCTPDQVVVTAGAQHAIDLVLRVLVGAGDPVWVEDPCYPAVRAALAAARARIVPVPVDAQGMVVEAGISTSPSARLAYVTPSSQYPLGVVLSMARRLELLAWARDAGAWVLEDDYDSEFRYAGRPLAALQGLDEPGLGDAGRVIYVGTFSKVLFPGLRLGYLVLPPALLEPILAARLLSDWHPPSLHEGVVTDFIEQGHFAQHLRRMRRLYGVARDALVAALDRECGDALAVSSPEQGLKLVARLRHGLQDGEVSVRAARMGLIARPLSTMFLASPPVQALMLGFSGHTPQSLADAARRLGACLRAP